MPHMCVDPTCGNRALARSPRHSCAARYGGFLHVPSEPCQILPDLPGCHLLVVAVPLVPFAADVVVDVVLVATAAERGPKHRVLLELPRRVEQVPGERLQPPL